MGSLSIIISVPDHTAVIIYVLNQTNMAGQGPQSHGALGAVVEPRCSEVCVRVYVHVLSYFV